MHNFICPWRQAAGCRTPLGNARMTFVKPFTNGKPSRYFLMLDLVRSQGPMSRREIVAQSFEKDEDQAFASDVANGIRHWDNISYGDYFTAFTQAGLLTYNRATRLWDAGPNLRAWFTEVVHPYLHGRPIITATQGKPEVKNDTSTLSTEQRLVILYRATKEKMQKLIEARAELDEEIRTVDKVLTAIETLHTFFPKMED